MRAYRYTGEYQEGYSELIYLRSSYVSPETGRFQTRDTWQGDYSRPGSLNKWSYVEANPANLKDPSGHDPWWCSDMPDPRNCGTVPPHTGKTVYLTFDDGPDYNGNTVEVAATLRQKNVSATFFVNGDNWAPIDVICTQPNGVGVNPNFGIDPKAKQVKVIYDLGHAIGLHGWTHNYWNANDPTEGLRREIAALQGMGVTPSKLLRAPGGPGYWPSVLIKGFEDWYYYNWDADSCDSNPCGFGGTVAASPSDVVKNIWGHLETKGFPDEAIVLLHAVKFPATTGAIVNPQNESEDLIAKLRTRYDHFGVLPRNKDWNRRGQLLP